LWQYEDFTNKYDIWAKEDGNKYETTIYKSGYVPHGIDESSEATNKTDFDNNYKPTANAKVSISTSQERSSTKPGRTYVTAQNAAVGSSGSATVYTVTQGKTLYITSALFSGFNTSITAASLIRIEDGSTTLMQFRAPAAGLGAVAAALIMTAVPMSFPEPLKVTTNIKITISAGTVTTAFSFVGYEE